MIVVVDDPAVGGSQLLLLSFFPGLRHGSVSFLYSLGEMNALCCVA